MGVQSGFHTPVYPSMKWLGNGTSEEVISIIRVIIECHHRSWLEVVLICKGPWLTSWKIVFRYWRTLTVGPTAVPPPWEKINVDPMSIYTWPRNFSRQPLNFNQKFMKVLICAWLYLSCSIPFNHLSLICLGCCAEPPRPDTNCGGLVWWEWWEWWECDAHLTILSFRDKNTFLREVGQTLRKHLVLMVDNSRCVEVSQIMVVKFLPPST